MLFEVLNRTRAVGVDIFGIDFAGSLGTQQADVKQFLVGVPTPAQTHVD
jgi:hypothetical protein